MKESKEKQAETNILQDLPSLRPIAPEIQAAPAANDLDSGECHDKLTAPESQADLISATSLAKQAAALPDVRQEKVAAVRAAIADGTYEVSSEDVAQSLIDHMLDKQE
jgi:flagellar biosynthesis anti-sigma factor FlgM